MTVLPRELSEEDKMKLLQDLKRSIVPNDSDSVLNELKVKLLETVELRRDIVVQDLSRYLDACSFYFASPKMVFC